MNYKQMEKLVEEMAQNGNSNIQYLSFQFFVRGKAKNLAIYEIFLQNN